MKISLFVLPIIAMSLFLIGLCGNIFSPTERMPKVTTETISVETPLAKTIKLDSTAQFKR